MALSVGSAGPFGALNGYWGQDGSERLADYCDSGIQYVTLSFVNEAPENSASGYPGTNFAGHCWAGTYNNTEGVPSNLLSNCMDMKEDIGYCQSRGVKVLLSIGGEYDAETSNYEVTTEDNGRAFADFLYGAFGPYDPDWDGPRPFDNDGSAGGQQLHTEVDGWDFDIEKAFPNAPYMAMIERFRELDPTKLIAAAPQCPTDLLNFHLRDLVLGSAVDLLFVQFYNNPGCDAVSGLLPWDRFNYDAWADLLDAAAAAGDASRDTKLFIGLPASPAAAGSGYVGPEEVKDLVCRYKDDPRFGGVSLWDLSRGRANVVDGKDFNEHVLDALRYGCDPVPEPEPEPTTTAASVSTASTTALSSSTSLSSSPSTTPISSSSTITSETPSISSPSSPSPTSSSSLSSSSIYSTPVQSTPSSTPSVESSSTQSTSTSDAITSSSSVSSTHPPFPTLSVPHNWNTTTTTSHGASTTSHSQTTSPGDLTTVSQSETTTSSDGAAITQPPTVTSGTVSFTTSTSFTTVTRTITDCPPYVVDCPEGGYVTTIVVPVYTTVCPITDVPEPTQAGIPDVTGDGWTTSTMYITKTKTITDCGPHVECPEGGVTTTEVIVSTTVCPVEPTHDIPAPPGDDGEHDDDDHDSHNDDGSEHGGDDNEEVPGKPSVTTTATTVATVQPTKPGDGGWVSFTKTNIPTGAVPTVPGAPQPTIPVEAGASGLAVGVSGIIAALALQLWL